MVLNRLETVLEALLVVLLIVDTIECWKLFVECIQHKRSFLDGYSAVMVILDLVLIIGLIFEWLPGTGNKRSGNHKLQK